MVIAGFIMTIVGLSIQIGAIIRLIVLRRHHRRNSDWEHLPIFRKWRLIETLSGSVAVFSILPFGIAQMPELAGAVLVVVIAFFIVGAFVGGGEGEGAN